MSDKRLFDFLHDQLRDFPQARAFGRKAPDGGWRWFSTAEIADLADRASLGLLRMGLAPGDKVATVVHQCSPEWVALDLALLQIGLLNVPMYPTISPREYAYILNEAEVKLCFVGDDGLFDKVQEAQKNAPTLREILTFHARPTARRWDALLADGDRSPLDRIRATIRPDDEATIIYTSGTTGNPKGVVLTHRNIAFNVEAMRPNIPIAPGERGLSFLPVSHIFERAVVYAYTAYGASVAFTGLDNLGGESGDFQAVRPHFFTAVPRLLEKVFEKIYAKGLELKGFKRAVFFWAMKLADNWDFDQKPRGLLDALRWKIADALVFSKWRAALGGNLNGIITGASACPVRIMRAFNAAGVRIREGYGLTESAPGITFNRFEPGGAVLGTVGPLLEGVEVRIEPSPDFRPDEGEILAKSPGIMVGYYKQPEKTAEMIRSINGERWLATGDVGRLVEGPGSQKFLKITDRKKELLKTSGGKYVAPAPIEAMFKEHGLVEQAMVVGENLKFVSALLVPSADGLRDWCQRHGVVWTEIGEILKNPRVLARYQMLVDRVNPFFGHAEQVKKFALLPATWEAVKTDGSDAELTPTMKLKRRVILEKFRSEISEMYA